MMHEETFDIQELVKASGIPRRTIYFYVQQGLLPPPEGAGLAAYYTAQHTLRLRLIPIFRSQGLRLDDIRRKFEQMTPEEMQQAAAVPPPVLPSFPPAPKLADDQPANATTEGPQPPALRRARDAEWLAERRFTHYQLPGGISLMAPADLPQPEQQRLARLLQAAAQIYERPASRNVPGSNDPPQTTSDDQA
jgi:DNA-binding transcriptional MerR regulator